MPRRVLHSHSMHGYLDTLASLAGDLALATGSRAQICLGCPVREDIAADLTVVRGKVDSLPLEPADVLLAVFLRKPSAFARAAGCARAGVPEVWLVGASGRWIEKLWRPVGGTYRRRELLLPAEAVSLVALPEVTLVPFASGGAGVRSPAAR